MPPCDCGRPDCQFALLVRFSQLVGLDAASVDAFMFMGTCEDGHPKVWHYKHSDTRGYLHLDAAGHAYSHHMTGLDGCAAQALPDVASALREVLL